MEKNTFSNGPYNTQIDIFRKEYILLFIIFVGLHKRNLKEFITHCLSCKMNQYGFILSLLSQRISKS